MKLYFSGNYGDRVIAEPQTYEEINKEINKFLDDHNFKSYYSRMWFENNNTELWIDVGSHTEFFIVKDFSDDLLVKLKNLTN